MKIVRTFCFQCIFFFFILFGVCDLSSQIVKTSKYKVVDIDRRREVFIVYFSRNDSVFKVVSKRESVAGFSKDKKLKKNNLYSLDLKCVTRPLVIEGVDRTPTNYLEYKTCIDLFGGWICTEPQKGIVDLYVCDNLKGIYILDE